MLKYFVIGAEFLALIACAQSCVIISLVALLMLCWHCFIQQWDMFK